MCSLKQLLWAGAAFLGVSAGLPAFGTIIYDSNGFELPRFSSTATVATDPTVIGNLRNQDINSVGNPNGNQWRQFGTANGNAVSTATVQAAGGLSGQGVQLNRLLADNRWSPIYGFTPNVVTSPIVDVSWSERVLQTAGTNLYGPFFGVEVNQDTGAGLRAGALGVDAKTGEILIYDPVLGLQPTPADDLVNFGDWNDFRLSLNYATHTYSAYLNGGATPIATAIPFTDAGVTRLDEAFLAGLFAADPSVPGNANDTGTAFFDNYVVSSVPEPTSAVLLAGLGGLVLTRRRKLAK